MNASSMEEDQVVLHPEPSKLPLPQPTSHFTNNLAGFSNPSFPIILSPEVLPSTASSDANDFSIEELTLGPATTTKSSPKKLIRPMPIVPIPPSSKMAELNLNQSSSPKNPSLPLSLKPSTPSSEDQPPPGSSVNRSSAVETMSGSGDGIISVV